MLDNDNIISTSVSEAWIGLDCNALFHVDKIVEKKSN